MKPKVSICMITYNHEKYIAQAIESVLMQKTNFDYELVIGEDFSTDKTREIVIKYQKKYPNKIKLVLNKRNLGMVPNFIQTLKKCRGKYIALLEGDDYWTLPHKLQRQADLLDNNQDYTISSHNVYVMREGSKNRPVEWLGTNCKVNSTLEDRLRNGSGGATCSLVFRSSSIKPLPKWFYISASDWPLQVLCTSKGKMYYFREVMAVYRQHKGSATDFEKGSAKELDAFLSGGINLCEIFDKHFNYKYTKLIKEHLIKYMYPNLVNIYKNRGDISSARKYSLLILRGILSGHIPPYKEIIKHISLFIPRGDYEQ